MEKRGDCKHTLSLPERLEGGLVAQGCLTTLHDEGQARVDALLCLFLFIAAHQFTELAPIQYFFLHITKSHKESLVGMYGGKF